MPTILLIEDEPSVAEALTRLLEVAGAGRTDWAADPAMASAAAGDCRYDIVISDYDLGPRTPTGVDLLTDLRTLLPAATMICISGTQRVVPGWCHFVHKLDLDALRGTVTSWQRDEARPQGRRTDIDRRSTDG